MEFPLTSLYKKTKRPRRPKIRLRSAKIHFSNCVSRSSGAFSRLLYKVRIQYIVIRFPNGDKQTPLYQKIQQTSGNSPDQLHMLPFPSSASTCDGKAAFHRLVHRPFLNTYGQIHKTLTTQLELLDLRMSLDKRDHTCSAARTKTLAAREVLQASCHDFRTNLECANFQYLLGFRFASVLSLLSSFLTIIPANPSYSTIQQSLCSLTHLFFHHVSKSA